MSTLRQAAVLLANLPGTDAAALLGRLDPKQVRAVRGEIARVDASANDELRTAFGSFSHDNPSAASCMTASFAEFLHNLKDQDLLVAIRDEHPQTIALIVGHLPRTRAIQLLLALPAELRAAVVQRIGLNGQAAPDVLIDMAAVLRPEMANKTTQPLDRRAA